MQSIIYDVAVSIDGFICGPSGDVSAFPHKGLIVDDYFERLSSYSFCLMGRKTYEFGYAYGLEAGDNPYPHMDSYVFSSDLACPSSADVTVVRDDAIAFTKRLKRTATGPIYLCGGGEFAGHLLAAGLIDTLRLKRAPILLGDGVRLFGSSHAPVSLKHNSCKDYGNGYWLQEYTLP